MCSVVKMKGIHLVLALALVVVAYGLPADQPQAKSANVVAGVFIPSDAFKNLQDRANANSPNNQQPIQAGQPTYQPVNQNQPQYQTNQQSNQPPVLTNQQPAQTNNPTTNNQQPGVANQQPLMTIQQQQQPSLNAQPQVLMNQPANSQPFVYQQSLTANRDPNQQIMVMTNQPNQKPSQQSIVLLQQPSTNQPIYVQQPNQLGNQGYVVPSGQPSQVIIASNPSNGNQIQGTLVTSPSQNQPGSTVYTLIPLNGQSNINSNSGGSYIIPVQSGNSNPIILNSGK